MADTQLDKIIRYHERLTHVAKLLEATTEVTLEELTIKYLKRLKELRSEEEAEQDVEGIFRR